MQDLGLESVVSSLLKWNDVVYSSSWQENWCAIVWTVVVAFVIIICSYWWSVWAWRFEDFVVETDLLVRRSICMLRWRVQRAVNDRKLISVEELCYFEKKGSAFQASLRKRLATQRQPEIMQLVLLCAYHGLSESFSEVVHAMSVEDTKPSRENEERRGRSLSVALQIAAKQGHDPIVSLLIQDSCVDINAQNSLGNSALHLASCGNHSKVVRLLVEKHAKAKDNRVDPNASNRFNSTPLSLACERGFEAVVNALVDCDDLDPSVNDNLAVRMAAQRNHDAIVLTILKRCRKATFPRPGSVLRDKWHGIAQAQAVLSARVCMSIMRASWLEPLPPHIRAYIVCIAFANSLVLLGPSRGKPLHGATRLLLGSSKTGQF